MDSVQFYLILMAIWASGGNVSTKMRTIGVVLFGAMALITTFFPGIIKDVLNQPEAAHADIRGV